MNSSPRREPSARWNHNIHYHRVVLDAVPDRAGTALDVGTGDGLLATELREKGYTVTAIDTDGPVLERARRLSGDVDWAGPAAGHPPLSLILLIHSRPHPAAPRPYAAPRP